MIANQLGCCHSAPVNKQKVEKNKHTTFTRIHLKTLFHI